MSCRNKFWHRIVVLMMVLTLIVPVLAGCDGDDEEENTTAPAAITPGPTVSNKPVKIGVISSWSGSGGMAGLIADGQTDVLKKQMEEMGGILIGNVRRPVEFVNCDDGGMVAGTMACYTKLVTQDKVSAVIGGGGNASCISAASDAAESHGVPLFSQGPQPIDISDRPFTIRAAYTATDLWLKKNLDFILTLNPKTVLLLFDEGGEYHDYAKMMEEVLDPAGVEIVDVVYVQLGTHDYSPYLTKVKRANPDLFVYATSSIDMCTAIYKQMVELGGWGNIENLSMTVASSVISSTYEHPGAVGSYHWSNWVPELEFPENQRFIQAFRELHSSDPIIDYNYVCAWTAIHAIELAGSDEPAKIAQAARSGKLAFDSPAGPIKFSTDGENDVTGFIFQVQNRELVMVME